MPKAKTAKKNNNSRGGINTKALLIVLLVVLVALAGWLYYDNRTEPEPPVEFQNETGAPPLPTDFETLTPAETPAP